MSIIVPSSLAAAIEAAERQPIVRVLVDWDGDGFGPVGSLDDLTGLQGAIKITRQLTTDLPDPVRIVEGSAAATATVDLVAGDPFDAAMHAARYFTRDTDSPIGHLERINRPTAIDIGFMTEQGPIYVRRMTGRTRNLPSSSSSRSAQLVMLDNRARLRNPVTLPPTNGAQAGANGVWLIFHALQANGVAAGPVPGPGLLLWSPCYGCIQPWLPPFESVSPIGFSNLFRKDWVTFDLGTPDFIAGPYVLAANAFYHTDADLLQPVIAKEVVLAPGQTWDGLTARFEAWTYGAVSPTLGPAATSGRCFTQYYNSTNSATGKTVLGVRHAGNLFCDIYDSDFATVIDRVDSTLFVPGDGSFHFVGVHADTPRGEVTFRLDDSEQLRVPRTRLNLPGIAGAYLSTPDAAPLDITGDIDIRIDVSPTSFTPAVTAALVSKWGAAPNRSYLLNLTNLGQLQLAWTATGSGSTTATSTDTIPNAVFPTRHRLVLRAILDVDNGAGGNTATFYYGPTLDGPWTQLGAPVTAVGVTSIFNGNLPVEVGSHTSGTSSLLVGVVHGVQIHNGINGSLAANPLVDPKPVGTTSFNDGVGRSWTVNGAAGIVATFITAAQDPHPDSIAATFWVPSSDLFVHACPADTPWRNENVVVEAVLDKSRLNLVAVVEPFPLDPQDLISEMAKAEQATAIWDEAGIFRYRTRDRLVKGDGAIAQRVLTTQDGSLLDVNISDGIDQVRNIVQVTYTPYNPVSQFTTIYIEDTVRILPSGGTAFVVSFTDPLVFLQTVAFPLTVTQWNIFGPGGTGTPPVGVDPYFAITTHSDGSVDDTDPGGVLVQNYLNNVTCTITQWNSGAALVVVTNSAPVTLYIAHLSLKGRMVQRGNQLIVEARDEASIAAYGPQGLQLTLPTWVQTGATARSLALTLLGDLAQPRPTVTGLRIVGDPRRQLGDRVILADPDGTQLRGEFWLTQINDDVNANGAYVQEVSARAASTVLRWGIGRWGMETWG